MQALLSLMCGTMLRAILLTISSLQVLLADREVLQDQVVEVEMRNEQLNGENEELRLVVQTLGLEKQKVRLWLGLSYHVL